MLALFDCGIRKFCSIAGTSVGALNAALCHQLCRTGDRRLPLQLWTNISFSKVLKPSLGAIKLIEYFSLSLFGYRVPYDDSPRASLPKIDHKLHNNLDILEIRLIRDSILIITVLTAFLFLFLVGKLFSIVGFGLTYLTIIIIPIISFLSARGWLSRKFGFFSNARLRRTIESVDVRSIMEAPPPIVCTITTSVKFGWLAGLPKPLYVDLSTMKSPEEAVDLLLQSASLPEVFSSRAVRGHSWSPKSHVRSRIRRFSKPRKRLEAVNYYVDGGLADNTPILGVADELPDTIIVVYLNHRFSRLSRHLRDYEAKRLDVICYNIKMDWWNKLEPWFQNLELIAIIPSQNIGNLINGTLNFSATKARSLIGLGFSDTLMKLWAMSASDTRAGDEKPENLEALLKRLKRPDLFASWCLLYGRSPNDLMKFLQMSTSDTLASDESLEAWLKRSNRHLWVGLTLCAVAVALALCIVLIYG